MRQLVLVVEDDEAIRQGLVDALGFEGYAVMQAGDRAARPAPALERATARWCCST